MFYSDYVPLAIRLARGFPNVQFSDVLFREYRYNSVTSKVLRLQGDRPRFAAFSGDSWVMVRKKI